MSSLLASLARRGHIALIALSAALFFATPASADLENRQPTLALNYYVAADLSYFPYPSPGSPIAGNPAFLGEVKLFNGPAPAGYLLADGQLVNISTNSALFSLFGTIYGGNGETTFGLPDLRGRVPVGAGTGPGLSPRPLGSKGGTATLNVAVANLPPHTHTTFAGITGSTGSGVPLDNMQPWLALTPLICIEGEFPSSNGPGNDSFLGEIKWFGGTFAPGHWTKAEGQILPISQFPALFSIHGTIYGGDGEVTFGLPDLRGRTPIHHGQGPGLSSRPLGWSGGNQNLSISTIHLPVHHHPLPAGGMSGSVGSGFPIDNMMPSLALNAMLDGLSGEVRYFAPAAFFAPWPLLDGGVGSPDQRGRAAIGTNPNHLLGSSFGQQSVTLGRRRRLPYPHPATLHRLDRRLSSQRHRPQHRRLGYSGSRWPRKRTPLRPRLRSDPTRWLTAAGLQSHRHPRDLRLPPELQPRPGQRRG